MTSNSRAPLLLRSFSIDSAEDVSESLNIHRLLKKLLDIVYSQQNIITGWEGVDCSVRAPLPLPPPEPKLHLPTDYVIVSPSGVGCPDKCHGRGECRGGECMCDSH